MSRKQAAARRIINLTAAGTYEFTGVTVLRTVTINTGETSATVALTHLDDQSTPIATIDADNPSTDRSYHARVRGLSVTVTGAPDVTITVD